MKNKLSKFFSLAMLMSGLTGFVVGCGETGTGPGGITATPGTFRYEFEECEMTDGAEEVASEKKSFFGRLFKKQKNLFHKKMHRLTESVHF